uniref:Uncharacterized protein n=1 Tax=viral metagenome TaxID=1070528 RepID=A0A6H1ZSK9_9ZZZZ
MTRFRRLKKFIREKQPRIITKDRLQGLKFRAVWHCYTCSEEHDRNRFG